MFFLIYKSFNSYEHTKNSCILIENFTLFWLFWHQICSLVTLKPVSVPLAQETNPCFNSEELWQHGVNEKLHQARINVAKRQRRQS